MSPECVCEGLAQNSQIFLYNMLKLSLFVNFDKKTHRCVFVLLNENELLRLEQRVVKLQDLVCFYCRTTREVLTLRPQVYGNAA